MDKVLDARITSQITLDTSTIPSKFWAVMMQFFNRLILSLIPFIPRFIIKQFAGKYVAGITKEEALSTVKSLNEKGYSATIDILGEHVNSRETANSITQAYIQLFQEIQDRKLDCNISFKPTHIGIELDETIFEKNIKLLLSKARDTKNFLRIDMEDSSLTDRTINAYKNCLNFYSGVGTVFQAYLLRTGKDIPPLFSPQFNFRLCKGIYRENPKIAMQDRNEISKNFIKLLRMAFKNDCYVGIATHDLKLLNDIYALIKELNVPLEKFEFQVLYGVPMSGWLEEHLKHGYKVRVYVPFGPEWYDYSIRRLKENPNIVGYVMNNLFQKR